MRILIGLAIWFGMGYVSWVMVRRAHLHDYPCLRNIGKAWTTRDSLFTGILSAIYGPAGIIAALVVYGGSCFKKP